MIVPTYPDSRVVAATVQERFARHIAAARQQGQQNIAPQPDALTIEAIINAAFWASLRREESYFPEISLRAGGHRTRAAGDQVSTRPRFRQVRQRRGAQGQPGKDSG